MTKVIKRVFALCGILSISVNSFADGGLTYVKLSKSQESNYVTALKIGELRNVLGTKQNLPIFSFAGLAPTRKLPLLGIGIGYNLNVAENLTVTFGPVVAITNGKPVDVGLSVGVTWKF